MRVLLHTPLKPPDSPTPSGDREMARGLRRLLRRLGHTVVMPALSRVAAGVPAPQDHLALERRARSQARRLIARWRTLPARHPERFDLWLTYHCYYRKPDWLGPIVTRALGVPYALVEASHAPRRAQGPTRLGHRAVERALAAADLVLTVNPRDVAGVKARLRPGAHQVWLPPFIDTRPFAARAARGQRSAAAAERRHDAHARQARLLSRARRSARPPEGQAVARAAGRRRAGARRGRGDDGAAQEGGERVRFAGAVPHAELPATYASADLYLWPAINEAYGMAFLEAQAAGLPVVAGRTGGVPAVVADGVTGVLTPIGDAAAFAAATARLLDDPKERVRLGKAARARVNARHDERAAARALAAALRTLR